MDERKLVIYKYLVSVGRFNIDDVPEPYKSEIEKQSQTA